MPALVNYSGDDLFSIGSRVDACGPPRKRARLDAQFAFAEIEFELDNQPSIEILPDECLFEIFRRLPGVKERSFAACVSKKMAFAIDQYS